jgi:hypothetical protein
MSSTLENANPSSIFDNAGILEKVMLYADCSSRAWTKRIQKVSDSIPGVFHDRIDSISKLELALTEQCDYQLTVRTCISAAKRGHLDVLRRVKEIGGPWGYPVYCAIIERQEMYPDVVAALQTMFDMDCPMHKNVFNTAVQYDNLEILNWLNDRTCPRSDDIGDFALKAGHITVISWLFHSFDDIVLDAEVAAATGETRIISWFFSNGLSVWASAYTGAASGGHIAMLDWLFEQHVPLSHLDSAAVAAARHGHIGALEWLVSKGLQFNVVLLTKCGYAGGDFGYGDMLYWLIQAHERQYGPVVLQDDEFVLTSVAATGRVDIAEIIIEKGALWNCICLVVAAQEGYQEFIDFAIHSGCPLGDTEEVVGAAADNGHEELVRWLVEEKKFHLHADVAVRAARGKQPELLRYLHEKGCPLDRRVVRECIIRGEFELVKWLSTKVSMPNSICNLAATHGHLNILKWAVSKLGFCVGELTCRNAAEKGHLQMLRYLRDELECPWNGSVVEAACVRGHVDVVQYALEHNCVWDGSVGEAFGDFYDQHPAITAFMEKRGLVFNRKMQMFV